MRRDHLGVYPNPTIVAFLLLAITRPDTLNETSRDGVTVDLSPGGTRNVRGAASALQLRDHAGDVAHAPMFGDLSVAQAKNVAGGEAQRPAGRRKTVIGAVLGSLV